MTNQEAIKYLQQLYPNGGHCWLDEQRIEAIGMAIKALQEEPESKQNLSNVQRTVKNLNEDFENALAEEWKGYNDRGAAKVDALEDNTQELAFAKGFYRGWHYMDDDGLRKAVEGVSKELSDYINELSKQFPEVSFAKLSRIAVRVAKWHKEQFEKKRLAACDRQTEEEAEREQDFVMGIIEKEHRQPTFDDAIKYGMRLQRENMMKDAVECTICASYENPYGGFTQLVDSKTPLVTFGKEVKLIIIKED